MQASALYDPHAAATPSQLAAAALRHAFHARIALAAKPRVLTIPVSPPVVPTISAPAPAGLAVGYIPPPWIPPDDYSDRIRIDVRRIQIKVAEYYGLLRTDLLSSRRTAVVVRPRQVAMYLAKTMTLRSLPEIGRFFGGRDHTTVLHAVRKISALIERDEDLKAVCHSLEKQLRG